MRILVCLFALVALSGCKVLNDTYASPAKQYKNEQGQVVSEEQQKELEVALLQDFQDIPIPVGYRVDLTESTSFYSNSYAAGKITIKGPSSSARLFVFYTEEMSANGWTLITKMQSSVSVLNFAKPGKMVSVHIFLDGSVTLIITPE